MFAAQSGPESDPFAAGLMNALPVAPQRGSMVGTTATFNRGGGGAQYVTESNRQPLLAGGGSTSYDDQDMESVYTTKQDIRSQIGGGGGGGGVSRENLHDRYPPIDPRTRLERTQKYHDIRYPLKSQEEVELEKAQRMNENNLALENQIQMVEFSKEFMNVKRSAVVPQHCSNLHHNSLYGEVRFGLRGDTAKNPIEFIPKEPLQCYGSIFDWAQGGVDIRPSGEPDGDLKNVYLIRYLFSNFRSTAPVAVGVLLGEKKGDSFIPLGRQTAYCDINYSTSNQADKFHYIIPPFGHCNQERDLYRSSTHVNNNYGRDYPFLTSDRENILHRCDPMGTKGHKGWLVPLRHPIANWCFEESNLPDSEMPKVAKDDKDKEGGVHFRIPKKTVDMAVQELQKKASMYIPVTDMASLTVRFYPLVNGPLSCDQILRSEMEREHEVDGKWGSTYGESVTKTDAKKAKHRTQLKQEYGISFTSEFFIMFRKWAADAIEETKPEEENPYAFDDDDDN